MIAAAAVIGLFVLLSALCALPSILHRLSEDHR